MLHREKKKPPRPQTRERERETGGMGTVDNGKKGANMGVKDTVDRNPGDARAT